MRGKGIWLAGELVDELAEFMAYCCADWKNKNATVAGKLVAVNLPRAVGGAILTAAAL